MEPRRTASPLAATIASIVLPGLGYWLIGERKRALLTGLPIILLFTLGLFIAGVRVISVPGFDEGYKKYREYHRYSNNQVYAVATTRPAVAVEPVSPRDTSGRASYVVKRLEAGGTISSETTYDPPIKSTWILLDTPVAVLTENLWFLGQMLNGPICGVAGYLSIATAQSGIDRSYARLADMGSLYTAVSGMLNLMIIVDCAARARRKAER